MNREHLNNDRPSVTHKLVLQSPEGKITIYFTIGLFLDTGKEGEIFIIVDKECSGLGSAYHSLGIALSMLLQSGWTVEELAKKFAYIKSVPNGFTGNEAIPNAHSIIDYLMRWLQSNEYKEAKENVLKLWRGYETTTS